MKNNNNSDFNLLKNETSNNINKSDNNVNKSNANLSINNFCLTNEEYIKLFYNSKNEGTNKNFSLNKVYEKCKSNNEK